MWSRKSSTGLGGAAVHAGDTSAPECSEEGETTGSANRPNSSREDVEYPYFSRSSCEVSKSRTSDSFGPGTSFGTSFESGTGHVKKKKGGTRWLTLDNVKKLVDFMGTGRGEKGGAATSEGSENYVLGWVNQHSRPASGDPLGSTSGDLEMLGSMGSRTLMDVYGDLAKLELGRRSSVGGLLDAAENSVETFEEYARSTSVVPYDDVTFDELQGEMPGSEQGVWLNTCTVEKELGICRAVAKCMWRPSAGTRTSLRDVLVGISTSETLHHPNIEPLLGWSQSTTDNSLWVFTMYDPAQQSVGNVMIHRYLGGRPPLWTSWQAQCVHYISDVLNALSYLHSPAINLVHGRLGVSNILLSVDWAQARISDCVLNRSFEQKRALTVEHDIRSVGFVVWQLVCGRIIQEPRDPSDFSSVSKLHRTPDRVVAHKITHKGMRALFKACVHTPGSKHVAMRTVVELQGVMTDLARKGLMPAETNLIGVNPSPLSSMSDLRTPRGGGLFGSLMSSSLSSFKDTSNVSRSAKSDSQHGGGNPMDIGASKLPGQTADSRSSEDTSAFSRSVSGPQQSSATCSWGSLEDIEHNEASKSWAAPTGEAGPSVGKVLTWGKALMKWRSFGGTKQPLHSRSRARRGTWEGDNEGVSEGAGESCQAAARTLEEPPQSWKDSMEGPASMPDNHKLVKLLSKR